MSNEISIAADIKLSPPKSDWEARLKEIKEGEIIICTYFFSDLNKTAKIIAKRQDKITLIANTKFFNAALAIKKRCPLVKLYLSPNAHAKMVLIQPETMWISTENFGGTQNSFDATVRIDSAKVYDHYYRLTQNLIKKPTTTELKGV